MTKAVLDKNSFTNIKNNFHLASYPNDYSIYNNSNSTNKSVSRRSSRRNKSLDLKANKISDFSLEFSNDLDLNNMSHSISKKKINTWTQKEVSFI